MSEAEITPCGRGADSYACGGCYCGLETRQNVRLRADLEAARESSAILDTALQHCCEANQDFERRLQQSRATEAELRAKLEEIRETAETQLGEIQRLVRELHAQEPRT